MSLESGSFDFLIITGTDVGLYLAGVVTGCIITYYLSIKYLCNTQRTEEEQRRWLEDRRFDRLMK